MTKKILLLLSLVLTTCIVIPGTATSLPITIKNNAVESKVLLCNSKNAYAYHSHHCQGLKRCKSSISEISLSKAKAQGRKACGYCY